MARRVRVEEGENGAAADGGEVEAPRLRANPALTMEAQEPFMGVKVRRRSSMYRQFQGDYINVAGNQHILKLLTKQGDRQVLFADNVIKVNRRSKVRKRVLLITDVALYSLDADWFTLKRRISLSAIEKVLLSELNDNFFALSVSTEYDCLFASTHKTEIVTILQEATRKLDTPLEVCFSNRFEYYMDSENIREVIFEEVPGGVKTTFVNK
ncbi:myosin ID heavy chain [Selaginella moellendorffii]|nr:myosin ID heavy chain [Selaginella moellendorffii]|eukprot:XP_002980279.2 myosin ID heavy chain [Selaginella moellendorffii]